MAEFDLVIESDVVEYFATMTVRFLTQDEGGFLNVNFNEVIEVEPGDTAESIYWMIWEDISNSAIEKNLGVHSPVLISWSLIENALI
jgi:hypothetical protein